MGKNNRFQGHHAMAALLSFAALPVWATDAALLEVLLNNKLISKQQYEALKDAQIREEKTAADRPLPAQDQDVLDVLLANGLISQPQYASLRVKTGLEKKTDPEAKASLKDGIKLKSQDGSFQAQIGAYAQLDSAFYSDDPSDFSDATQLRRARLSVAGTDYKVEANFAGTTQDTGTTNEVTITNAYLRYTGFTPFSFTAGSFKVPFSLEAVSSAKYITFMERGLPFAFLNLRALGGMAAASGDNWTASVGAFGDTVTTENSDDEGKSVAARITYAPFFQSDRVLHLGASGAWREPFQNGTAPFNETVRFRSKPESNPITDDVITSRGRLVDTGNIPGDVQYLSLFGAEVAGIYGPFSVQGISAPTSIAASATAWCLTGITVTRAGF